MQSNYGAFRVCVRTRIIQPRRGDLNFRPVQIRFICQPQLTVWRGAPCSPQRTWAENDVFECFYSIPELFSLGSRVCNTRQKRSKGLRPAVFVPRTLGRTWGTPRPSTHGVRIECFWRNSRCYHNLDRNLRLSQLSISMKSAQQSPLLP